MPYDLALDLDGRLLRIQVKGAWYDPGARYYVVDARRTKTNRRRMLRERYDTNDFDFAILHIDELNVFYVMPVEAFVGYGSTVSLVEDDKRQRKPRSAEYKNRWGLLSNWAPSFERRKDNLSNSVEPEKVIPSQALVASGKV